MIIYPLYNTLLSDGVSVQDSITSESELLRVTAESALYDACGLHVHTYKQPTPHEYHSET